MQRDGCSFWVCDFKGFKYIYECACARYLLIMNNCTRSIKWTVPLGLIAAFGSLILTTVGRFDKTQAAHRTWRLNRLKPNFLYMASFVKGEDPQNEFLLKEAIYYYQTIAKYFPFYADGYAMLGFCYHKSNQMKRAEDAYRKAVDLKSRHFWPQHNLSILLYKQHRYREANQVFNQALEDPFRITLETLRRSLVFKQIQAFIPDNYMIDQNLNKGISNLYSMLALSHYFLGDYKKMYGIAAFAKKIKIQPADRFTVLQEVAFLKLNGVTLDEDMINDIIDECDQNIKIEIF